LITNLMMEAVFPSARRIRKCRSGFISCAGSGGFAKYYHPKILKGDVNWDYELFRVLPAVIGASDEEEVNAVLYGWIHKLGTVKENESEEKGEIVLEAGTDWIYDSSYLSPELSSLLINISKSGYIDKNRSYVSFDKIMVPQ